MAVCQACGVTGWSSTLILCSSCQIISEHSYCLDQSITTDDGEVIWVCEFCEPQLGQSSESESLPSLHEFREVKQPRSPSMCLVEDLLSSGKESSDNLVEAFSSIVVSKYQETSDTIENDFLDTTQPLPDSIWRGRFCIYGKYSCTTLAHMSNEACVEASETVGSFPKLLGLEIVPKINIWPLKFTNMVPTSDNISVYFFPKDYRDERVYDRLVEYMIEHDCAMISRVQEVELLVFSSRELHLNNWRFQRKYYLWGIIRRKKKTLPRDQGDISISSQYESTNGNSPPSSTTEIGAKDKQDGGSLSQPGE